MDTTPQCVSCFHHTRCETCETEHSIPGGKAPRLPDFEPLQAPTPEVSGQSNTSGLTTSTPQSMDVPTPSAEIKSSLAGQSHYSPPLEFEDRTEQVLLMQNLSLNEVPALGGSSKVEVDGRDSEVKNQMINPAEMPGAAADTHRDDYSQSSPGESTPGSELSDSSQENEYEREFSAGCDAVFELLNTPFNELFEKWLEGIRGRDGGTKGSSSGNGGEKAAGAGKRQDSKRKRADNSDEQDTDTNPERPSTTAKKRRKMMPLDTQLACPYFKKDPRRHRACCGYGGQKLSYVKQHLNRNHTIALYCPVCILYFPDERLRDDHIRARSCEPLEDHQPPEGITLEQRLWLSKRGPSHLSEEQHWYRIFEYLFPRHPLPRSPYNDTTFSEEFLDFREFLEQPTGLDMLLSRVRQEPNWTAEIETRFVPIIRQELGQLYWTWAAARQGESSPDNSVETPHESPSRPSPQTDTAEDVRQSNPQPDDRSAIHPPHSPLPAGGPGEGQQLVSQTIMESSSSSEEQVGRGEFGPLSGEVNANSESGQQRPGDGEEPGEGGEPSTISMSQIGHDQPEASWMSLDFANNEFYDWPGHETLGISPLGDSGTIHPGADVDDSGFLSIPLNFREDDVPFSLEEFEVPDEEDTNQGETRGWVT